MLLSLEDRCTIVILELDCAMLPDAEGLITETRSWQYAIADKAEHCEPPASDCGRYRINKRSSDAQAAVAAALSVLVDALLLLDRKHSTSHHVVMPTNLICSLRIMTTLASWEPGIWYVRICTEVLHSGIRALCWGLSFCLMGQGTVAR